MERCNGHWIQVRSGGRFFPLDPRPEDIHIEDVAHALSNICRFTGHTAEFMSVAQHSVLVSLHCWPEDALFGLLHDTAEAFLADLSRPVKLSLRDAGITIFDDMEARIMLSVCEKFGLPAVMPQSVKDADNLLLTTEARDLMSPLLEGWKYTTENGWPTLSERIVPVGPVEAKAMFIRRFEELSYRASIRS